MARHDGLPPVSEIPSALLAEAVLQLTRIADTIERIEAEHLAEQVRGERCTNLRAVDGRRDRCVRDLEHAGPCRFSDGSGGTDAAPSAAPDLLEAAEQALGEQHAFGRVGTIALDALRAAVAKAGGHVPIA
jgi:hypothetical protein